MTRKQPVSVSYHDACIRAHAVNGASAAQLAEATGATAWAIRNYCARNGIELAPGKRGPRPGLKGDCAADPRTQKMAEMYRQGLTLEDVARQFGITRERVRQLLKHLGITKMDGGQSVRTKSIKAASLSRKRIAQAKQEARFGVPYELLQELRANGATRAFNQQRMNAAHRGIEFKLTLAQWWAVWQTSGKFDLKGRGAGRYCMSRIRDDGAYELGNVHIQLTTENSREAVAKWKGKTKTHRGVFCLYPGREKAWHARCGDVSLGYHSTAEEAAAVRAEYMKTHGIVAAPSLGKGRGWTFEKRNKSRPYMVQVHGTKATYHATPEEARAEYLRRCAEVAASRAPTPETAQQG